MYNYQTDIDKYRQKIIHGQKKFDQLGYLKLCFIAALIVAAYLCHYHNYPPLLCALIVIMLATLVILWIKHAQLDEQLELWQGLIGINQAYIERQQGTWVNFPDNGSEFFDINHPFAADLDLVGPNSLFQLLNTSHTWHGRQAFVKSLLYSNYDSQEIKARQSAVIELSNDRAFAHDYQYHAQKIGASNFVVEIIAQLSDSKPFFISSSLVIKALMIVPWFTTILFVAMLAFNLPILSWYVNIMIIIQLLIWRASRKSLKNYLQGIVHLPYQLKKYSHLFYMLDSRTYQAPLLKAIQEKLVYGETSASQAIKELDRITNRMSFIHNGLVYLMLNALLMWDYRTAIKLDRWKKSFGPVAEKWFTALGEYESLHCLANLAQINLNTCIPKISDSEHIIDIHEMGHPLIPETSRVCNDFYGHDNIFVISGSNMSGKTTFLRTLGLNIVLAQNGGYVCAKQFVTSLFRVYTSMRIADDLSQGLSTYYAELVRIKAILNAAQETNKLLFLIDEIFRGTNSYDRLFGAKSVIIKLDSLKAMGLISTHDLEICKLEDSLERLKNMSFCEQYYEDKMSFDYRIKEGPSQSSNARFLMKQIGIEMAD